MKNLSSEARSLVEAARGGDAPSPADSARVKRALATAIAAGAAGTSASAAAAATTRSAVPSGAAGAGVTAGKIAGWVGIGATVGLATAGTWAAFSGSPGNESHPPAEVSAVVAPVIASPPPPSAAEVSTDVVIAPAPATSGPAASAEALVVAAPARTAVSTGKAPPRTTARATAPASSLAAETALIQSARAALGGGDAHGALALLREHARDYPNGVMVEERLASQVFASCALGQRANAARAAAELIRRAPSSPLRARVLDSCAGPR